MLQIWPSLWRFQTMRERQQRNIQGTHLSVDSWEDAVCHNPPDLRTTNKWWNDGVCVILFLIFQCKTKVHGENRGEKKHFYYLLCQIGRVCRVLHQSSLSQHNCQKPISRCTKKHNDTVTKQMHFLITFLSSNGNIRNKDHKNVEDIQNFGKLLFKISLPLVHILRGTC